MLLLYRAAMRRHRHSHTARGGLWPSAIQRLVAMGSCPTIVGQAGSLRPIGNRPFAIEQPIATATLNRAHSKRLHNLLRGPKPHSNPPLGARQNSSAAAAPCEE